VRVGVGVVGAPCVAQRVWPMPTVPAGLSCLSWSLSTESFPAAFRIVTPFPLMMARPAESLPAILHPAETLEEDLRRGTGPMFPAIPHLSIRS
jgi:hypothetical protein